jgi:hypothetical protein
MVLETVTLIIVLWAMRSRKIRGTALPVSTPFHIVTKNIWIFV